ncbi:MAG: NAD(P)/FAD-dependent oxidoreductase, partial [Phototrophicaceae bacterium]
MTHYDVIIIGGRVAGTSLAARLGAAKRRVLLLERESLPMAHPASSPVIYAPAMELLDEIGADEACYAANTPKLTRWIIEAAEIFSVEKAIPARNGRAYAYAVDRATFDKAIWDVAAQHPSVTVAARTSVLDLLTDADNRVIGVRAKQLDSGVTAEYHAPLVVGADGRFSIVARKVNAAAYDVSSKHPTSNYYAYWKHVQPVPDGAPAIHLFSTGGDYGILTVDSADGTTLIGIEGRADTVDPKAGDATAFYLRFLQSQPQVWARLAHAERVTDVHGMKKISNLYRQSGGEGWALVGDALHQKDPLDGQGIYDALFTAKALAAAILRWQCDGLSWQAALEGYTQQVRAETLPMYRATLARVEREIYTRRPVWFMHTLAKWLYYDEVYLDRWARVFTRQIDPDTWF